MRRYSDQRGSTLILLVGIIAAVAILSTSLVVMTNNDSYNTGQVRSATKSFDVAESALDRGMHKLATSWPLSSTLPATWTTIDQTSMRDLGAGGFSFADYPAPRLTGAQFTDVMFVDNQKPINYSIHYDKGGPENPATPTLEANTPDNKMYVIATATTGKEQSRVMALVERTFLTLTLPRGVALAAGGDLLSNGGGNNPKIEVEVAPPGGIITAVHIGGAIEEGDVTAPGIVQNVGGGPGIVANIFSPSLAASLKATAEANGRLFTSYAAAEASPAEAEWSPQGGLSGLTVIQAGPTETVIVGGNTTINSELVPGMLLILGGAAVDWRGNGEYFGIIYCEGAMDTSRGTADIHGMVVTTSNEAMKGTPHILYNDNCIARLQNHFSLNVKMVTNTWRELDPDTVLAN
jgi:hypothetical protein